MSFFAKNLSETRDKINVLQRYSIFQNNPDYKYFLDIFNINKNFVCNLLKICLRFNKKRITNLSLLRKKLCMNESRHF